MNEYFAEIIDAANEGIYVTDCDRRFRVWNDAAEKISGYAKSEMIGRCCHDNILCHSDREGRDLCFFRCPLQAAIRDGLPHGPEVVYLRHKTGKRIAVEVRTAAIRDEAGHVVGGVEVFQDVTERLENQRLLQERKEKLETVLNSISDGILFFDTKGTISVINHACASMFGVDNNVRGPIEALPESSPLREALSAAEKAYRRAASDLLPRNAPVDCREAGGAFRCWNAGIDRAAAGPSSCYSCPTYHAVRSFLEKPLELTRGERTIAAVSSFIESPDTNELWELMVFHDVTAEKLDAALKVAGAAAHEMRQPLQVVVAIAGLVEGKLRHDRTQKRNLEMLLQSCSRMDDVIKKMCDITSYRTKEYVGGIRILDFERSATRCAAPSPVPRAVARKSRTRRH